MNPDDQPACRGKYELFDSTHLADHAEARKLCAACPVIDACTALLQEVQADTETMRRQGGGPVGTWAGKLFGKQGRRSWVPREHGTEKGYQQHRSQFEDACPECREACRVAMNARTKVAS